MNKIKAFGKCESCRKWRFFIRVRKLRLPMGLTATNRQLICTPCFKALQNVTNLTTP